MASEASKELFPVLIFQSFTSLPGSNFALWTVSIRRRSPAFCDAAPRRQGQLPRCSSEDIKLRLLALGDVFSASRTYLEVVLLPNSDCTAC
jgi:hypothetical protein